jgi:hypothetical protein
LKQTPAELLVGLVLQVRLEASGVIKLEHRRVLVVHRHEPLVVSTYRDPLADSGAAHERDLPERPLERIDERVGVRARQVSSRPKQDDVRDQCRLPPPPPPRGFCEANPPPSRRGLGAAGR